MSNQNAPLFDLNKSDFLKAAITAALVGGLSIIAPALSAGTVLTAAVLKAAGYGALSGFIGYLMKNLMTNSQDKFLIKEPPKP